MIYIATIWIIVGAALWPVWRWILSSLLTWGYRTLDRWEQDIRADRETYR